MGRSSPKKVGAAVNKGLLRNKVRLQTKPRIKKHRRPNLGVHRKRVKRGRNRTRHRGIMILEKKKEKVRQVPNKERTKRASHPRPQALSQEMLREWLRGKHIDCSIV
jgi:hypothetical protein